MPLQRTRPAYLDVPFTALAHRGGFSAGAPRQFENSLRAFSSAWDAGYRYLETDVHVSRDGVLVAFHDDTLDRATDAVGKIADLDWAQLRHARIGGAEPIARMSDLLAAFPEARFNIDLKATGVERALIDALQRHDAWDRVCVGSFSGARLRKFRALSAGRVVLAAPPFEVGVLALLPALRRVLPLSSKVFQVPESDPRTGLRIVSRRMIDAVHRRGASVHVWTVNDRVAMERLIDLGVDGIVTDDIETLKDVLMKRKLWEGNA